MKINYTSVLIVISLVIITPAYSQTKKPKESSFHPPINIPIRLSGNFGELRSGHFHSGIDIKTQGVTGHRLYAIEDGYVSRIKITSNGYGKALYIHHPEIGYTSVYAHLESFNKKLESYILEEQYKRKTYEIQLFPEKDEFKVSKGEFIAYSGNSGSSIGPHLHFEIRKLANQHPVNPLFYNFAIQDNIPPKVFQVAFYPQRRNGSINRKKSKLILNTRQIAKGKYTVDSDTPVLLSGPVGIGVKTYDFLNNSNNWCGIYSIELLIDSTSLYQHEIDEFAFQNTRYINALIDYEEKIKNNASIQKLFLLPNNKLNIYNYVKNSGIYKFSGDTTHRIHINIKDVYGNLSEVSFLVKSKSIDSPVDSEKQSNYKKVFPFNTTNKFYTEHIKLDFPVNAFYDTVYFDYNRLQTDNKTYFSDIHQVHNEYTPVHKYYTISIKSKEANSSLKEKMFIVRIGEDDEYSYVGGKRVNDFISAKVRELGDFAIIADTLNPRIEAITNMQMIHPKGKITFKIEDDLSGVDSYNGFIDGEWALFEYDQKNDLLVHHLKNSELKPDTTHEIELYVGDKMNNIATYYTEFKIKP